MSRKYKFHNPEGLYFISFATVYWLDVFVRDRYFDLMLESLDYCRKNKGMEIYSSSGASVMRLKHFGKWWKNSNCIAVKKIQSL
ncbi:hypothetical protein N6H18_03955 [Reichenbachiella agarivorans]|uniref:Transposase n=1 Tax=Reichenbachiella agarivorans TaxID=2979464 RepID=A0ABY6CRI2_9BACT|nr:hypothetical protein [Reichenbachiella agarivorans]UXP33106.1 hypothetical protein N6H18_03955 [Reichenbachiella agarivorans]